MFDEMTYKEMEHAMKLVMKAEDNRLAELREVLLGDAKSKIPATDQMHQSAAILNAHGSNQGDRRHLRAHPHLV